MTEIKQPYTVDRNSSHLWATSEDEAHEAFTRKYGQPPRYVVPASLEGCWMAGPIAKEGNRE